MSPQGPLTVEVQVMRKHGGPVVAQRDSLAVVDCLLCGWRHLLPLPDAAALDDYYKSDFWQTTKHGWRDTYAAQAEWLATRAADWLSVVESHAPYRASRSLLDIGAGYGHFAIEAYKRGWATYTIDPSADCAPDLHRHFGDRHLRGGWDVPHPPSWPATFDAVSALWLMEHLPDPVAFLGHVHGKLAADGVLLLVVPQEWTQLQTVANDVVAVKSWWVDPTHLHYWSQSTLFPLLKRCGFRIVDTLATYPVEWWLLGGHDYTAAPDIGAEGHARVRAMDLKSTHEERILMAHTWAEDERGRDLVVVARRDGE